MSDLIKKKIKKMKAIVSYTSSNVGCQVINNKLCDTSGGGGEEETVVEFDVTIKNGKQIETTKVAAFKAFAKKFPPYIYGNGVRFYRPVKVKDIIK